MSPEEPEQEQEHYNPSHDHAAKAAGKKAQRKNLVLVTCQQDKPQFYNYEFDFLVLWCYNHTVSSMVFYVSSYILVLRFCSAILFSTPLVVNG